MVVVGTAEEVVLGIAEEAADTALVVKRIRPSFVVEHPLPCVRSSWLLSSSLVVAAACRPSWE